MTPAATSSIIGRSETPRLERWALSKGQKTDAAGLDEIGATECLDVSPMAAVRWCGRRRMA